MRKSEQESAFIPIPAVTVVPRVYETHAITIQRNAHSSSGLLARQLNSQLNLEHKVLQQVLHFFDDNKHHSLTIPAEAVNSFVSGNLDLESVILNPVHLFFLSSYGLLNGSMWTSNVPSDGMWTLSDWVARYTPQATVLCVDPNMFTSFDAVADKIVELTPEGALPMLGFSLLPVNLQNDLMLISQLKQRFPSSTFMAGGIGSDSLSLIPTKSGKVGIEHASPIDFVIPGVAVLELSILLQYMYLVESSDYNSELSDFMATSFLSLYTHENWDEVSTKLMQSRTSAKNNFIPIGFNDLVHSTSYAEANAQAVIGDTTGSTTLLTDNRCDQNCSYCAVPKSQMFDTKEQELDYILSSGRGADIISFNNNDLANFPDKTIWLCEQMYEQGLHQPKHGKMRIVSFNESLIRALAKANFKRIAVGVESFDDVVRGRLSKPDFGTNDIQDSLELMLRLGITPEINIIAFNQFDTLSSLEFTTRQLIDWVDMGATAYVTFGTFATLNSPSILKLLRKNKIDVLQKKVHMQEVHFDGMSDALLFPTQWKTSEEVEEVRQFVEMRRHSLIKILEIETGKKVSVPIEAYVAVALLAQWFTIDGFKSDEEVMEKVYTYFYKMAHEEYISI